MSDREYAKERAITGLQKSLNEADDVLDALRDALKAVTLEDLAALRDASNRLNDHISGDGRKLYFAPPDIWGFLEELECEVAE